MTALLWDETGEPDPDRVLPAGWIVDGKPYANAAAKFWASLIDEMGERFPACDAVELRAPVPGALDPDQLYPEKTFERDLQALLGCNIREEMARTWAELALVGPPAPVSVRLLAGGEEILARALPGECVDADIFPFLLVWILAWCGIPEMRWNDAFLSGECEAEDRRRNRRYRLAFTLVTEHLSEGLYTRRIALFPTVEPLPVPDT